MTFIKTTETEVRYENYGGVYILNRRNQNKTKIINKEEAYLFWLVSHSKHHVYCGKIRDWISKGYIRAVERQERNSFEEQFKGPASHTVTPILATVEITSRCNYQCEHCGNNSGQAKINELAPVEIIRLINQMAKLDVFKLTLTGGETLLKLGIWNILKCAVKKIPRVTVTSNGSLINESLAKKLKSVGVAAVKISLDGGQTFHDTHRGQQGAYQQSIYAIKCLNKVGLEVRVQSTLMRNNGLEIIKLMPILAGLRVKVHSIVPVAPIGRASINLMMPPEKYRQFISQANEAAEKVIGDTVFEIRPVFGLNCNNNLEVLSTKYKCEALKTTFEINSLGKVVPCSFLPIEIGDVRKNSLLEIWQSKKANEIRKMFDENRLQGKCVGCVFKKKCGGGCVATSYAVLNKKYHPDIYCWR